MSYMRCRKRELKDGTTQSYWYRCEAYWEGGRSHERVLEYLGKNPHRREETMLGPHSRLDSNDGLRCEGPSVREPR